MHYRHFFLFVFLYTIILCFFLKTCLCFFEFIHGIRALILHKAMILVKPNTNIIIYSELENAQNIFSNFWTM